jgi:glycosyltransferase involved in cell wall biosynthesis
MKSERKTLVIISAFNEEGSVGKVVEEVKTQLPGMDALVVNDGSTDLTSEIGKSMGAVVLDLLFNLGSGGAMQAGYQYGRLSITKRHCNS